MKTLLLLLIFTIASLFSASNDPIKTVSFNIRYGLADDGNNSWKYRKQLVFDLINAENADFVGLQEALVFQTEEIIAACPQYQNVGRTRDANKNKGEATPILYKIDTWELLDHGTRWLSETPEIPGSISWDSSLPRIFTWARFKNINDRREITIYNTHYDHISGEARYQSSRSIISFMQDRHPDKNIILLGDLNALEEDKPILYLTGNDQFSLKDAYRTLHPEKKGKDATYYGWREHIPGEGKRIDYIFFKGKLKPVLAYVSDYNLEKRYPSDHMPVIVSFKTEYE